MVHICGLIALSGRGTPESVLETGIGEKRIFEAIYCFSFVCKKSLRKRRIGLSTSYFIFVAVWTGAKARIIWCIYRITWTGTTIINLVIKLLKPSQATGKTFNFCAIKNHAFTFYLSPVEGFKNARNLTFPMMVSQVKPSLHLAWIHAIDSNLLFELQFSSLLQVLHSSLPHPCLLSVDTIIVFPWISDHVISMTNDCFQLLCSGYMHFTHLNPHNRPSK